MTSDEVRKIIREELRGEGVAIEFAELVERGTGDSGTPQEYDSMHPMPMSCETDDLEKFFQVGHDSHTLQKLNRNPKPENKPAEETSCEAFFDCEKRASSRGTIKLTKRLIETGEVMVEHWNHEGECIATTFISADAVDERLAGPQKRRSTRS